MHRGFGDFQTPLPLVADIIAALRADGVEWERVLEPTCGHGNFIEGLLLQPDPPREVIGIEVQGCHASAAQDRFAHDDRVRIVQADLFGLDLAAAVENSRGALLVIGNPPWVTNSKLGSLGSTNLPPKENLKGFRGLDALTGASNFDIAEYIWLKLIRELQVQKPVISLLCKIAVARKVLEFSWQNGTAVSSASIRRIDAGRWFGAAVDACLLTLSVGRGPATHQAKVFDTLSASMPTAVIGMAGTELVADIQTYAAADAVEGTSQVAWRSGVKHDAATVMELVATAPTDDSGPLLTNGLGEQVSIESDVLHQLVKSTDLFHGRHGNKWVVIPQRRVGDDTSDLARTAPLAWSYLTKHGSALDSRRSSIYRNRPRFSIFGIGEYSFAPYKVAISGLHKQPRFRLIGPRAGRAVMLDDTSYFLPESSLPRAAMLTALLNSEPVQAFLAGAVFLDSKRPYTKRLLQRIDIAKAFDLCNPSNLREAAEQLIAVVEPDSDGEWPTSASDLTTDWHAHMTDRETVATTV